MLPLLFVPAAIGAAVIGRNIGEIIRRNRDQNVEQRKEEKKSISIYKDCGFYQDNSTKITINHYQNCTFNKYDNCKFNFFGGFDLRGDEDEKGIPETRKQRRRRR